MVRLPPLPDDFRAATALRFTPDGRELAVGYQTTRRPGWAVAWWDVAAGTPPRERRGPGLALGGCGRFVSTLENTLPLAVRAFVADSTRPLAAVPLDGLGVSLTAHVVAPGGEELVVGHPDRLGVHPLPDGGEAAAKTTGDNDGFDFSPSGRWLVGRATRAVRLWDRAGRLKLVRLKADAWTDAAVSCDDRFAAVSGPSGQAVTVWNLATRTAVRRLEPGYVPRGLAWLPDGRLLVSVKWWAVATWDVAAGQEAGRFELPGGLVCRLAVAPDGLTAAALMFNRADGATAVVWDT